MRLHTHYKILYQGRSLNVTHAHCIKGKSFLVLEFQVLITLYRIQRGMLAVTD